MEYLKAFLNFFTNNLNSILSFIALIISCFILKLTIKAINIMLPKIRTVV